MTKDTKSTQTLIPGSTATLRAKRLELGLSLRKAAHEAHIDPGHLSKVERGMKQLSVTALSRLARVLGLDESAEGPSPDFPEQDVDAPTLDDIRSWPATVDLATGGRPFGISRSYAYELAKRGEFPAKVIQVGGKARVVTASILAILSAESRETA